MAFYHVCFVVPLCTYLMRIGAANVVVTCDYCVILFICVEKVSVFVSCYHLYAELPLMEKQSLLVISLLALPFTCCVIGWILALLEIPSRSLIVSFFVLALFHLCNNCLFLALSFVFGQHGSSLVKGE